MRKTLLLLALAAAPAPALAAPAASPAPPTNAKDSTAMLDLPLTDIDGQPRTLRSLGGKALLVVNVASRCGFTPQYEGLEALWKKYKDKGLVIAGFPSNDFGAQEPGTEAEIKTFCSTKYGVSFPMFAKVKVLGPEKAELYRQLTASTGGDEVKWNFTKFLVAGGGTNVKRFESKVKPDDTSLVEAVEAALK